MGGWDRGVGVEEEGGSARHGNGRPLRISASLLQCWLVGLASAA